MWLSDGNMWLLYREYSGHNTGYTVVIIQGICAYHTEIYSGYYTKDILVIIRDI